MADEIFDVVNAQDEVIGQAPRREVHARGLWHRAVHVLVFNAQGGVFLQKRSMLKDIAKGKWDSSASGHLDTGEDYDACAVRELREEIGLQAVPPPVRTLHPEEIETGGWFAPAKVTQWVAAQPEDFASAFVLIWQRWQQSSAEAQF